MNQAKLWVYGQQSELCNLATESSLRDMLKPTGLVFVDSTLWVVRILKSTEAPCHTAIDHFVEE